MSGLAAALASAIAAAVLIVRRWFRCDVVQRSSLPPEVPGAFPWIGNVFGVDKERPHITLSDWAYRFGHVYRFRMFGEDIVVLNSLAAVRQALVTNDPAVAGRPDVFRVRYGFHYVDDIIFATDSPKWRHLKRLTASLLRQTSAPELNERVNCQMTVEMRHLEEFFELQKGHDFDPSFILQTTLINVVSVPLHGRRYDHDDPRMFAYKRATRLFSEACSPVNGMELDLFPWLRFLPHKPLRKLTEARALLDSIVNDELLAMELDSEINPTDDNKCLLRELLRIRNEQQSTDEFQLGSDDIRAVFIDILISGTLTTVIALKTLLLLMVCHTDLQRQLALAIDDVVGRNELPTLDHRNRLGLVDATVLEVLRYLSHVPLSLPHFTTDSTQIAGYSVPKHTKVLINLWSIHHADDTWSDPWTFRPDRFLDPSSGQLLDPQHPLRQSLIPFGLGRRTCMGQTFAVQRLFVLTAFILQRFELRPPDGEVLPSCDPRHFQLGLILEPQPFKIRAFSRYELAK